MYSIVCTVNPALSKFSPCLTWFHRQQIAPASKFNHLFVLDREEPISVAWLAGFLFWKHGHTPESPSQRGLYSLIQACEHSMSCCLQGPKSWNQRSTRLVS